MANLTVAVDENLIRRARMRAIEQGTSLSAKVREFLQGYADAPDASLERQRAEATARLMASIDATTREVAAALGTPAKGQGGTGRRTLRDEIYGEAYRGTPQPDRTAKLGRKSGARR
jgi:plasmid stability protein